MLYFSVLIMFLIELDISKVKLGINADALSVLHALLELVSKGILVGSMKARHERFGKRFSFYG